jgi:hypothetical protein
LNTEVHQVCRAGELDRSECSCRSRDDRGESQRRGQHPEEDADVDPESCHHGRTASVHESVSRDESHVDAGRDHDNGCNGEKRTEVHRPMIASASRSSNKIRLGRFAAD